MSEPDDAPGWAAIDAACAKLYPDQANPPHWAPPLPPGLGPDALNGVSVYRAAEPAAHWHYVCYGLSDLFGDEVTDDPDARSGAGFEMTFRLLDDAATDPEATPPLWPISLLSNLAKYVVKSGRGFAVGHHLNANGPIKLDDPTLLHALTFILDPQLGSVDTPAGRVEFLQLVGLTSAEEQAGADWEMNSFMELVLQRFPMGITVLERSDLMAEPGFAAQVAEGTARQGSSSGAIFISHLQTSTLAEDVIIELGAIAVPDLLRLLPLRVGFGRDLIVQSADALVLIRPGLPHARSNADGVEVHADDEYVTELVATLKAERGDYRCGELDYLVWRVAPSEIKDADGNVVQVLG